MALRDDLAKYREYRKNWARNKRLDPNYRRVNNAKTRDWQLKNPEQSALTAYRSRAKRLGRSFDISNSDFIELIKQSCCYCGAPANPVNGLDRIDSDLGYTIDNVRPACRQCNIAKNNYTADEFVQWIKKAYEHIYGSL